MRQSKVHTFPVIPPSIGYHPRLRYLNTIQSLRLGVAFVNRLQSEDAADAIVHQIDRERGTRAGAPPNPGPRHTYAGSLALGGNLTQRKVV
jgi:hypothetical protein